MIIILKFILLALIVMISGYFLSKYGDKLGDVTNIGKSLIGGILLSIVTSLPELVTSISSASLLGSPDLVISNVYGSNMFNLIILAVIELILLKKTIFILSKNKKKNIINFVMGLILMLLPLIFIFIKIDIKIFIFNLNTLLIFLFYVFSLFFMIKIKDIKEEEPEIINDEKPEKLSKVISILLLSTIIVIISSIFLVKVCDQMSDVFHLNKSFAGMIFLAIVTSLPELIVSLTAVKLGSYDMAVGNIYGSNIFNMIIIFVADIFYKSNSGNILNDISNKNLSPMIASIIMISLTIIGFKTSLFHKKIKTISLYSIILIIIYLVSSYLTYN